MRSIFFWIIIISLLPFIWQKPFWGLVLYACFNIIRPEMLFWGGRAGADVYMIIAGAVLLSTFFNHRFKVDIVRILKQPNLLFILWMYIALVFSILFSSYPAFRPYYFVNEILKIFILCLTATILIKDGKHIIKCENILLLCVFLLACWGIEQSFRGNLRLEGLGGRSHMDSNGIAALAVLFLPLAYNKIFDSYKVRDTIIGIVLSVIILTFIILTNSRGGTLGMVGATCYYLFRTRHKKKMLLGGILFIIFALPFLPESYVNRIQTISDEEGPKDFSAQSRLVLWKAGVMIFSDNPLLGCGFGSFRYAKSDYAHRFTNIDPELRDYSFSGYKVSHSSYFQILSEGGLLATIPYLGLILTSFIGNRRVRKKLAKDSYNSNLMPLLNSVESGILGYCICILTINALTDMMFPFQITISALLRKEINASSSPSR